MAETDVVAQSIVAGKPDNQGAAADGNQQGPSDWTKGLDEGTQKRLEKFKGDPLALAKSYVELETYASKSLRDMTDSEKEKFFKRLELPEKPEAYELSSVTLPDGMKQPPEADAEFKAFVHSLRLTKDQAKGLHEWAMKRAAAGVIGQREAVKRMTDDQESALRASWGSSFDGNTAAVEKVIRLGGDKFVERMNNGPGKDPVIREGLLAISKMFKDEVLVSGRVERPAPQTRTGFVFDTSKSPELEQTARR